MHRPDWRFPRKAALLRPMDAAPWVFTLWLAACHIGYCIPILPLQLPLPSRHLLPFGAGPCELGEPGEPGGRSDSGGAQRVMRDAHGGQLGASDMTPTLQLLRGCIFA